MGCNPGEAMYDKKGNGSKLLPSPKFYLEVIQYTSNYKVIIRWGSFLPHVLVHFAKSAWLYSVNPFSALFSANIQRNCPILFCTCPTYLPAGLVMKDRSCPSAIRYRSVAEVQLPQPIWDSSSCIHTCSKKFSLGDEPFAGMSEGYMDNWSH